MKRRLFALLFAVLMLCGCASQNVDTKIQVTILSGDEYTVERPVRWVRPGSNMDFFFTMQTGFALTAVDYDGPYRIAREDGGYRLQIENIRYPVRLQPSTSRRFCQITYDPNGGAGDATDITYSVFAHSRPNTSIGIDLFAREGFTLESWNTSPDGTGERIGLGSRVSVPRGELTLYAQWAPWSDSAHFTYQIADNAITITGYSGSDAVLAIPGQIGGLPVTAIAEGAFSGVEAEKIVLPNTLSNLADGAFQDCAMEELVLSDNLAQFGDASFQSCERLKTLYINAIEPPYGYAYRRESCYADKVDLLINAQGKRKLVCYGGCSMWYNLDGNLMAQTLGQDFAIVNMAINGTVSSRVQMEIIGAFLEEGDIFFHTPELSSRQQMMLYRQMSDKDDKLWCGLEYNYDLFSLVDIRGLEGVFDSFHSYLDMKKEPAPYPDFYTDEEGRVYMDPLGCVPFVRSTTEETLADHVYLDPKFIDREAMACLQQYYDRYQAKGVKIYVSHACVNMDEVPEGQRENLALLDGAFRDAIEAMEGPVVVSSLKDYVFHHNDYYDTNYHLLTVPARENTLRWLADLTAQLQKDGLWEGEP